MPPPFLFLRWVHNCCRVPTYLCPFSPQLLHDRGLCRATQPWQRQIVAETTPRSGVSVPWTYEDIVHLETTNIIIITVVTINIVITTFFPHIEQNGVTGAVIHDVCKNFGMDTSKRKNVQVTVESHGDCGWGLGLNDERTNPIARSCSKKCCTPMRSVNAGLFAFLFYHCSSFSTPASVSIFDWCLCW